MKFKDLFLLEQDEWGNHDDQGPDQPEDNDDINNPPLPADPGDDEPEGEQPPVPAQPRPKKQLSLTQQAKKRWRDENPGLTDFQIEDAAGFFRLRKDRLKPYHPYGYIDPQTNRHYINLPEVTALVFRFPAMEPTLSQDDKMKDMRNYPWEVMEFYMDNVRTAQAIIDEENLVPGTRLPYEEQLELAKEKWDRPEGRVVDEGGVKVYKIESKQESILYGSLQRILSIERRKTNTQGSIYWCTTVPLNEKNRSNLWTTYRPSDAFYYIWNSNLEDTDKHYCGSIQAQRNGNFTFVDLYNHTTSGLSWEEIVRKYPVLEGKQQFFPHFGTTEKEKSDFSISKISMAPSSTYFFGAVNEGYQHAYVDSGRHVNNLKAFETMRPRTRKLYVDKTSLVENDLQTRFVCSDPNNEFGILEFLRLQTKPEDLYKYLDRKILKTNLGVEEGVLALKKLIIGTNWFRGLSDDEKNITLISKRQEGQQKLADKGKKYGLVNTETGDIEESLEYVEVPQLLQSFVQPIVDENGRLRAGEKYMMRKYVYKGGDGNVDNNRGFYFFLNKDAFTRGENGEIPAGYLKGKYFTIEDGDEFIQGKLGTGELRRM